MRIVSTAWVPGSLIDFEASACLKIHNRRGAATAQFPYYVFILDGFDRIDEEYKAELSANHVYLIDATIQTVDVFRRFKMGELNYTPGQNSYYENLCFIRWIVISEMLSNESFLHIDTDLFFQRDNKHICAEFDGTTGTFGSPCLTAVSDKNWLEVYSSALRALINDRKGFQTEIGYVGNEFRRDISSDQDLTVALEARKLLPTVGLEALKSHYQVFINPLRPYLEQPDNPISYEDVGGIDYIAGREVLFWHLQNNFANYISRFATITRYKSSWLKDYLPSRLCFPFIQLEPSAENFAFEALKDLSMRLARQDQTHQYSLSQTGGPYFTREWASQYFIIERQGRDLFNDGYWWEKGLFS